MGSSLFSVWECLLLVCVKNFVQPGTCGLGGSTRLSLVFGRMLLRSVESILQFFTNCSFRIKKKKNSLIIIKNCGRDSHEKFLFYIYIAMSSVPHNYIRYMIDSFKT